MLNARDLKEYRVRRGFSQRDVSMYCNLTYRAIGMIENGERGLSEESYREIVQGINAATMARTRGAFDEDKKKAIDTGMNGHVAKPIDIHVLIRTLKEVLL